MNTTDTETPSEEGRSANYWEIIAREDFPQFTPLIEKRYAVLAMEIEALRANLIIDRFSGVPEMAKFLTKVLGWQVERIQLATAIRNFRCRPANKEDPEKYTDLCALFAEKKKLIVEADKRRYEKYFPIDDCNSL